MPSPRVAPRPLAALLPILALAAACASKTTAHGTHDAATCVAFALTADDLACGSDDDCTWIETGELCARGCCDGTPTVGNITAASRLQIQTASLPKGDCSAADGPDGASASGDDGGQLCAGEGLPACRAGRCVVCPSDACPVDAGSDGGVDGA